ncbi:LOW QUALITY PROTEIN: hypothetical protein QC764_0089460 [Podospora pseudoanserina]|uniref:Uncharacterized protein n=1 Tax=Podospora pseudoanserina TaxID=2609844 RepID=A0ABR0HS02_9PEZI|nr:LOW QUALITY PROTEIN: hypothetical protein QC764_0089460 [Podospora pseudoanserina]
MLGNKIRVQLRYGKTGRERDKHPASLTLPLARPPASPVARESLQKHFSLPADGGSTWGLTRGVGYLE